MRCKGGLWLEARGESHRNLMQSPWWYPVPGMQTTAFLSELTSEQ